MADVIDLLEINQAHIVFVHCDVIVWQINPILFVTTVSALDTDLSFVGFIIT